MAANIRIGASDVGLQLNGVDRVVFDDTGITLGAGKRLNQVVTSQTGDVATGTTILPHDNTIPQNTEGNEYMSVTITPQNVNSLLEIEVVVHGQESTNISDSFAAAVFQDSIANALAVGVTQLEGIPTSGSCTGVSFKHYMLAGTTSSTTFKVRAGLANAGTFVFNGTTGGTQLFGGVLASSIMVKEYLP